MKIEIETKLNVGDKIYIPTYDFIGEDFSENRVIYKVGEYVVIETEVSKIRVFDNLQIQYFFKGFLSLESENWFNENQEESNYINIGNNWFFRKEDAISYAELITNKEKSNKTDYIEKINQLITKNNKECA